MVRAQPRTWHGQHAWFIYWRSEALLCRGGNRRADSLRWTGLIPPALVLKAEKFCARLDMGEIDISKWKSICQGREQPVVWGPHAQPVRTQHLYTSPHTLAAFWLWSSSFSSLLLVFQAPCIPNLIGHGCLYALYGVHNSVKLPKTLWLWVCC